MKTSVTLPIALVLAGLGQASAQQAPGGPSAAVGTTELTFRSHQLAPGASGSNLEGASCPAGRTMVSGACHPGYSDGVRIINQFPNRTANAWRCGFSNTTPQQRSVWVYTLCAPTGPVGPPLVSHNLSVRRFTTTPLTNADADRILGDANEVAQVSDHAGDVACNVELRRDGNVGVMNVGDGAIDSSAEFSAVINAPGWIKAVNQINWCGSIGAGIIGCAPVPGDSLTVVRFSESLEGILWLHEFGHNKGRGHRNGTDNVMHPSIGASRVGLNADECDALRAAPLLVAMAGTPQPAAADAAAGSGVTEVDASAEHGEPPEDVGEFVRQAFFHGVPFELASQYEADDIPALEAILRDEDEEPLFRANAAATIGMIGAEESADVLISFIEEGGAGAYEPVSTAVLSLGYVANLAQSERALDYLIEHLDPDGWQSTELPRAEFQASVVERDVDLSKFALLGLAVSGQERAREAMRSLQPPARGTESFQSNVSSLVNEAIAENEKVARSGLEEYYEHK